MLSPKGRRTRTTLILDVMKLIMEKYPVPWKASELAVITRTPKRTVDRVLKDMLVSGLLEKRYHDYTLSTALINQFYKAQWYVRQSMDKDLMLKKED